MNISGCAKKVEGDVLAVVDGEIVTLQEFDGVISNMPEHYQTLVAKDKKKFLDDYIMQKLLLQEAGRAGIGSDPEIMNLIEEARKKILVAAFIKKEAGGKALLTDDALMVFYEGNKEQFAVPARWRASHILVATAVEAQQVKAELEAGADFAELAKERSKDTAAEKGGDVGYFSEGQLVPEFEAGCFALDPGELSDPIETQFGFHIIKLIDKQEAGVQEFAKVRDIISKEMERQKQQERLTVLFDDLRAKAEVTINEELIVLPESDE